MLAEVPQMTDRPALDRVGVIGSGLMGAEIALVFALAGHDVRLMDVSEDKLAVALQRLGTLLDKGVARGSYTADQTGVALGRIATTTSISDMTDRSVVVEAVFEQEAAKAEIFRQLDTVCSIHCVIATNTSTIPISVLASYVSEPRRMRFIGTHYFSPASRMKLVEVIPGGETSEETTQSTLALCRAVGKTPVTIKDVPGFAINRLLHVFMIEAVRLVEEGVATVEDIDVACRLGLGHPMGPFELMDATTSNLCLQAQQIMHEAYGERFRPRPLLKQRVRAGYVGGRGRPGWRTKT
jgi:3-hydroxybutyryl-CoA dehydrogenase